MKHAGASIDPLQEVGAILAAGYLRLISAEGAKRRDMAQLGPPRISAQRSECPCYQVAAE